MRFDGWSGGWPSYQDTKNRCWPTERCSESMLRACKMSTNWPRWPVSLMVMVHVCCEWAVSPQCVPLPASLTGYIWTCFLTARKVKEEKLGQRCSSPLRQTRACERYFNALRSLLGRSGWPCSSVHSADLNDRSVFKIKLCNSCLLSCAGYHESTVGREAPGSLRWTGGFLWSHGRCQ